MARSPAVAIAWQIWRLHRGCLIATSLVILAAGGLNAWVGPGSRWSELAGTVAYVVLALALILTCACFHFTEGQKRGGFGSFPVRLFTLPVRTGWLVALPMVCGAVAVLSVYGFGSAILFLPLGRRLPLVWPSLYLLAAFFLFQMILWTLASRRYLKLLALSFATAILVLGWMFFVPEIIQGTLADWGYRGEPEPVLGWIRIGLGMTGPAAFVVAVRGVRAQRHGGQNMRTAALREKITTWLPRRRKPFRNALEAVCWEEWRQTGLVLPLSVSAIIALTCIPSYLAGPLSAAGSVGILGWLLVSPLVMALIIGRAFGKPDFWKPGLGIPPFQTTRPPAAGTWIMAKLLVAAASVLVTWGLVFYCAFLWGAYAADFAGLQGILRELEWRYSRASRLPLVALSFAGLMILTWRFLVNGMAIGQSGRSLPWHLANGTVGIAILSAVAFMIWRSDYDRDVHLYDVWHWITRLPALLGALVICRMTVGARAWIHVHQQELLSRRWLLVFMAGWVVATLALIAWSHLAAPAAEWLRQILVLLSLLAVPFARPGIAILSRASNRSIAVTT
jgi:hypothetical protein